MISLWLTSLWAASVRGGLALLAAWVLCHIPRVPAAVRCWIWRASYLVLLTAFVWSAPVKLPLLRQQTIASPQPASAKLYATPQKRPATVDPGFSGAIRFAFNTTPMASVAPPTRPVWPVAAFWIWITFLVLYAGRLARDWHQARRLRLGEPIEIPELVDLCLAMNIRRLPGVRIHPAVRGPLLVGLWHPTIVLPGPMLADLRPILAHELAHLRRLDLLWNWLPTVAFAILPFHPLVWICNRQWRLATEAACDADTLAVTAIESVEYGRILVRVAAAPPPRSAGVLAVAVATDSRWILKQRLTAMANITHWNRRRLGSAGLIVGVFAVLAAIPWRVVAQQSVPDDGIAAVTKPNPPSTTPANAATTAEVDPTVMQAMRDKRTISRLWEDKYRPQIITRNGQPVNLEELKKEFNDEVARMPQQQAGSAVLGRITTPEAHIRSLISGTVVKLNGSASQAVKKGDLLAELESKSQADSVASAEEIVKASEEHCKLVTEQSKIGVATIAEVAQAKLELDKDRDLLRQRQAELDATRIIAPVDGLLGAMETSVGSTVIVGDPIAILFDTNHPTVEYTVTGTREARGIKVGDPIEIVEINGSKILGQGEITAVTVKLMSNDGPHTMSVRAKLTSTIRPLAPGEFVNVKFHSGE